MPCGLYWRQGDQRHPPSAYDNAHPQNALFSAVISAPDMRSGFLSIAKVNVQSELSGRSHRVPSRCFQRLHAWSRRQNSLHNGPRTQVPAESGYHSIQTGLKNVHCALQKVPFSYFLTSLAIYSRLCIQLSYFAPADFPAAAQYFPAGTPDQPFHPRHPSGPAPPERSSR